MSNWLRSWALVVGAQGTGISFSSLSGNDLRIVFEVTKTALSTPNKAKISLYNLSPTTENKIATVFTSVMLLAGYGGQNTMLFTGNIASIERKYEPPDLVSTFTAGDGDHDYQNAVVNTTVAAGTDHKAEIAASLGSMAATVAGAVVVAAQGTRLRGKVLSGPARDVLSNMARNLDAHWSIQDGKLVVCDAKSAIPTPTIPLVSATTGMIGFPEVTEKGLKIKMQLMPQLAIGGLFQLQTSFAQIKAPKQGKKSARGASNLGSARTDPNGTYKVNTIKHSGDSRGDAWSTEVECVRI